MEKNFDIIENDENQTVDDFYLKFKEELNKVHAFPTPYLFKYVVPADQSIIAQLHAIFEDVKLSVSTRDSKNGNYTSVTIKAEMNDADHVISYYKRVSEIKGVVAL